MNMRIPHRLATSGSFEGIKELIAKFYYTAPDRIELSAAIGNYWTVQSGTRSVTPIVIKETYRGRDRFVFGVGEGT